MAQSLGSLSQWYDLTDLCYSMLNMSKLDVYTTRTLELEIYLSKFVQRKKDEQKQFNK